MKNGWIKKLVPERGFGFIRDDQNQEYFFHRSALERDTFEALVVDQMVTFEVMDTPKGPRAENVQIAKPR